MQPSKIRAAELRWLSRQTAPVWGGHIERREPITDRQFKAWVKHGIIRQEVGPAGTGYRITPRGLVLLKRMEQRYA